ncbi:hypothetical protein FKM82_021480 [Ascaphus truei]
MVWRATHCRSPVGGVDGVNKKRVVPLHGINTLLVAAALLQRGENVMISVWASVLYYAVQYKCNYTAGKQNPHVQHLCCKALIILKKISYLKKKKDLLLPG